MVRQYSISEARNNLPSIVKQVEHGPAVELTRKGKAVVVLLSHKEYKRLNPPKPDLWTAIQEWRARHEPLTDAEVEEIFSDIRDRSPGRDLWTAIQEWREKHNVAELDLDPDEIWGDVRDRSPGRDFRFDD